MDLTADEIRKACKIAADLVARRSEEFKPADKAVIRNERGWICEQIFRGSVNDELVCSIIIQWNFPSGGAIGRITQGVHVRLRCLYKPTGRYLHVVSFHKPGPDYQGTTCSLCGDGFDVRIVVEADTSLHEF